MPTKNKSKLYNDVVACNENYAQAYVAQPDSFAHKHAAILTCMDSRLLPNEFMGFAAGDIHLIRNAGGRASDDAIRSLVISSKLLKTNQFFVIHHTDCGMQRFTDEFMTELLKGSIEESSPTLNYCSATLNKKVKSSVITNCCSTKSCVNYQCIDWLTIQNGLLQSVLEDVKKIRNHPFVSSDIPIYGFIFDVMTGKLIPVEKAMKAGKVMPRVTHKK